MNKKVLLIMLFSISFVMAWSQRQVTGTVTKEGTGELLTGVTISVKGKDAKTCYRWYV